MSLELRYVKDQFLIVQQPSGVVLSNETEAEHAWRVAARLLDDVLGRVHKATDPASDAFIGAQL